MTTKYLIVAYDPDTETDFAGQLADLLGDAQADAVVLQPPDVLKLVRDLRAALRDHQLGSNTTRPFEETFTRNERLDMRAAAFIHRLTKGVPGGSR